MLRVSEAIGTAETHNVFAKGVGDRGDAVPPSKAERDSDPPQGILEGSRPRDPLQPV